MMDTKFRMNDFWGVDNLIGLLRYVDIDVVVNEDVMMTVLLRQDRGLNVFLMMHGCLNVDVVIDVNLVVAVLLIDNWNVHHFLDRYWHGHVNNVFDGAVRDTTLRNDLWDMEDLLYDVPR